jgi:hypothetical protein
MIMNEVEKEVYEFQKKEFEKLIEKFKEELDETGHKTEDIILKLEAIDINQTNFEECDKEIIKEVISQM